MPRLQPLTIDERICQFSKVNAASRRVLLAQKPIASKFVCPSGEQVTNGDFETGDFTGWTTSNVGPGKGAVLSVNPYEGTYHCRLYDQSYGDPTTSIAQDFKNQIPFECLTDISVFQVALMGKPDFSPPVLGWVDIYLVYTDATETYIQIDGPIDWAVYNLKPYVTSDKTLKGIRMEIVPNGGSGWIDIDAVSLVP